MGQRSPSRRCLRGTGRRPKPDHDVLAVGVEDRVLERAAAIEQEGPVVEEEPQPAPHVHQQRRRPRRGRPRGGPAPDSLWPSSQRAHLHRARRRTPATALERRRPGPAADGRRVPTAPTDTPGAASLSDRGRAAQVPRRPPRSPRPPAGARSGRRRRRRAGARRLRLPAFRRDPLDLQAPTRVASAPARYSGGASRSSSSEKASDPIRSSAAR